MQRTENRYSMVESTVCIEGVVYNTYGIVCAEQTVEDVSTDKAFVEELIKKINEAELSPLHLTDVITDALI